MSIVLVFLIAFRKFRLVIKIPEKGRNKMINILQVIISKLVL
jgi:hypothetical protein